MKSVLCLIGVFLVAINGQNVVDVLPLAPERATDLVQASLKCVKELNLEKDMIQKFLAWELSDSDLSRKYIYCTGTASGYIADDGSLKKKETLDVVGTYKDRAEAVIDECNQLKYNDKYEAALRNVMCFYGKTGLKFTV